MYSWNIQIFQRLNALGFWMVFGFQMVYKMPVILSKSIQNPNKMGAILFGFSIVLTIAQSFQNHRIIQKVWISSWFGFWVFWIRASIVVRPICDHSVTGFVNVWWSDFPWILLKNKRVDQKTFKSPRKKWNYMGYFYFSVLWTRFMDPARVNLITKIKKFHFILGGWVDR